MARGATWIEHDPFAKTTVCVTVSLLNHTGYSPAGMVRTAGEGPVGVSAMATALSAEPSAGKTSAARTPARATCAINRQRRLMISRP
jgi:hypothetical protein